MHFFAGELKSKIGKMAMYCQLTFVGFFASLQIEQLL